MNGDYVLMVLFLIWRRPSWITASPIVNGFAKPVEPNLGAFPFQASLMQKIPNGDYHSFCGGSLIHPQWVLTAAHCIQLDSGTPPAKPEDVYVALGSIFRSAKGAQIIRSRQLTIHPTYLATDRNDIGLVKLQRAAKLGRAVNLVRLHTDRNENLMGKTAYLTGFGIINDFNQTPLRLRRATLHVARNDKCFGSNDDRATEICATSTIAEGKACRGDSGGPLTINQTGRMIQIGVTSHLAFLPLCRVGFNHSVYTKVAAYIAWITKITGINFLTYNRG